MPLKPLPARTVDLSQTPNSSTPASPQWTVRPKDSSVFNFLARETAFFIQILLVFGCSMSAAHVLSQWVKTQQAAGLESTPVARVIWSNWLQPPTKPADVPSAEPEPMQVASQAQASPIATHPPSQRKTPPVQHQAVAPRQVQSPRQTQVYTSPRSSAAQIPVRRSQHRTVSPAAQPIQQVLKRDYGVSADKPYEHYMGWVNQTLKNYQTQAKAP